MEYTENLGLKKPLQEEYYNVDDFNYNADIIDGAIKGVQDGKSNVNHKHDEQYLQLSGGTMTGSIETSKNEIIKQKFNDSLIIIRGGNGNSASGAGLHLYGSEVTDTHKGEFVLKATNGSKVIDLSGKADGTLSWDGKEIKSMAFPSATRVAITLTDSRQNYTAPANGYIYINGTGSNNTQNSKLKIDTGHFGVCSTSDYPQSEIRCNSMVTKGETATLYYENMASIPLAYFVYAEGEI